MASPDSVLEAERGNPFILAEHHCGECSSQLPGQRRLPGTRFSADEMKRGHIVYTITRRLIRLRVWIHAGLDRLELGDQVWIGDPSEPLHLNAVQIRRLIE